MSKVVAPNFQQSYIIYVLLNHGTADTNVVKQMLQRFSNTAHNHKFDRKKKQKIMIQQVLTTRQYQLRYRTQSCESRDTQTNTTGRHVSSCDTYVSQ